MTTLTIRKLNLAGEEVFRWTGALVSRTATQLTVEAVFGRAAPIDLGYTVFAPGDRFREHFYLDRWYNIYEVFAVDTGARRGWYCNIARPAVMAAETLSQVDLALDVWFHPDGTAVVLDEAEFAALPLSPAERAAAQAAVAELQALAAQGAAPFEALARRPTPGRGEAAP